MKIKCKKILSSVTGKNLGNDSPWLTIGKEYIVLALFYTEGVGLNIYAISDQYNEPCFFDLTGFEVISQFQPSSWVTVFKKDEHYTSMESLPESWNYESFFDDVEEQEPKAIALLKEELKKIYQEEKNFENGKGNFIDKKV